MRGRYFRFLIVLVVLLSISVTSKTSAKEAPLAKGAEEFVEWFVKLPLSEDEKALRGSLAEEFVYIDERVSLKEYHFEFDAEVYLAAVLADWEFFETLDIKIVRIRVNDSEIPGVVSVSAYFDVWLRDDYGIMGPLRDVYHFELVQQNNRWFVSKLIWSL